MARSSKGGKAAGWEYWSARPGNRYGGHHSNNGNNWMKRATHKAERRQALPQIAEQIEDAYTRREFMADICTPEDPCDMCKSKAAACSEAAES